jgi:DNA polymerase-3 subunit epsilon
VVAGSKLDVYLFGDPRGERSATRSRQTTASLRDPLADLAAGRALGAGEFVAIDFETATSSRASACAIGLAMIEKGQVSHSQKWLIRPPSNEYNGINISIHGIRPSDTADSPPFAEVWREVQGLIGSRPVVAHYAPFDISVLGRSLAANDAACPDLTYYCTWALSRRAWPGLLSYRLVDLANECGIVFTHHDPAEDAAAAAGLAIACCGAANQATLAEAGHRLGVVAGRLALVGWALSDADSQVHHLKDLTPTVDKLPEDAVFAGKRLVFTGTLTCGLTRKEAAQLAVNAGANVTEIMSNKVDFLVVGMQNSQLVKDGVRSGKMLKAAELQAAGSPIEVLSEEEFFRMLPS